MYLNGEGRPVEQLPLFLIMIATIIVPISNILTIYVYWKPVHQVFLWSLLLSVTLDVFYHITLLNWYFNGAQVVHNQVLPEPNPADVSPDDHRELIQIENGQLQLNLNPEVKVAPVGVVETITQQGSNTMLYEISINIMDVKSYLIFVNTNVETDSELFS